MTGNEFKCLLTNPTIVYKTASKCTARDNFYLARKRAPCSRINLIGYIIGMNDNGVEFAAWVQNARKVKDKWVEFGATQRAKYFGSQAQATAWAYLTARDRIEKL